MSKSRREDGARSTRTGAATGSALRSRNVGGHGAAHPGCRGSTGAGRGTGGPQLARARGTTRTGYHRDGAAVLLRFEGRITRRRRRARVRGIDRSFAECPGRGDARHRRPRQSLGRLRAVRPREPAPVSGDPRRATVAFCRRGHGRQQTRLDSGRQGCTRQRIRRVQHRRWRRRTTRARSTVRRRMSPRRS